MPDDSVHQRSSSQQASRPPVVLASGSPRRREILTQLGIPFDVFPPDIDESPHPGERPETLAKRLAEEKAQAVAQRLGSAEQRPILAADTIVVLDGDILGKPRDAQHARAMLARMTGRSHRVVTGVAVIDPSSLRCWSEAVSSEVEMRAADPQVIADYVATGEPLDKAGSYGVQGEGGRLFVSKVRGSISNVMGLPRDETLALLERAASETRFSSIAQSTGQSNPRGLGQ
jgi:septum formation protein